MDEPLVFVHQSLDLTLLRGDGVEALDVKETQPLNVYRSTILGTRGYIRPRYRRIDSERTLSVLW